MKCPSLQIARKVGERDTRLWRVFKHYVNKAVKNIDISDLKRVAMDETSRSKGHKCVTLFVDMDIKGVIFVTTGKGATVLQEFCQFLDSKGVLRSQIKDFCCDMSPSFISGIEDNFPEASITFDKFHVMKLVNEALDKVRRQEQQTQPELKGSRCVWTKNQENLTEK